MPMSILTQRRQTCFSRAVGNLPLSRSLLLPPCRCGVSASAPATRYVHVRTHERFPLICYLLTLDPTPAAQSARVTMRQYRRSPTAGQACFSRLDSAMHTENPEHPLRTLCGAHGSYAARSEVLVAEAKPYLNDHAHIVLQRTALDSQNSVTTRSPHNPEIPVSRPICAFSPTLESPCSHLSPPSACFISNLLVIRKFTKMISGNASLQYEHSQPLIYQI